MFQILHFLNIVKSICLMPFILGFNLLNMKLRYLMKVIPETDRASLQRITKQWSTLKLIVNYTYWSVSFVS